MKKQLKIISVQQCRTRSQDQFGVSGFRFLPGIPPWSADQTVSLKKEAGNRHRDPLTVPKDKTPAPTVLQHPQHGIKATLRIERGYFVWAGLVRQRCCHTAEMIFSSWLLLRMAHRTEFLLHSASQLGRGWTGELGTRPGPQMIAGHDSGEFDLNAPHGKRQGAVHE